jgi:hypothetical protein
MTATLHHAHPPVHRDVDELAPVVYLSEVSRGSAAPRFVVADDAPVAALVDHVRRGARVTLFLPLHSGSHLASGLGELGLHVGAPVQHPHRANPLVASTDTRLVGLGELAGLQLTVAAATALEGVGEPLAVDDDGRVVVRQLALGAGTLVVVGSAEPLTERLFASRDNVAFLTWAATGTIDHDRAARLASGHAAPRPHTDAPVLHVGPMAPLPAPDTDPSDPVFVRAAGHARRLLPAHVHDALVDFVDAPPSAGALLLRGLPVGELPATPPAPTAPTTKDHTSEMTLLTVARALGQPIGYLPEHGGDLVQNIVPVASSADRQTSTSSKVELMFHTEAAFHPHRPRYLLLLCLRGDPAAATTLASIHEIAPQLPLNVRAVLFEPRFRTAVDESYLGARPTRLGAPMPVLTGDWDHPTMVFDADLMVGMDDEAEAALQQLAEATERCHTSVVLDAGDLLVVDNSIAVHGRTPFTPRFDGTDRWLQRTFVVCDLAASSGERDGRVVVTEFMA